MNAQEAVLHLVRACGWSGGEAPRALVFVAHPDDEAIGLGGHLGGFADVAILHATDGAPLDLNDARAQGFADAAAYARARRAELEAALRVAGVGPERLSSLDAPDQEASRRLVPLTQAFAQVLERTRPDVVFTHAYEGGHPDHDAVALIARASLARFSQPPRPLLIEMPYYHSRNGVPVRQQFAPGGQPDVIVELEAQARANKQRMYAAFATQRETVALFHAEREAFRRAGEEDFGAPPNGGEIFYESFGWGRTGAEFVAEARAALGEMSLPTRL